EKTESLAKLKAGAETLDISASELSIRQRENALQDAKDKLADYFIRAPFDGTVATLTVKKTDSVGSGASLGTLITKQKVAEVSLNEVDVAKIAVGQEATLTFDAIDRLVISGKVIELDTVGTVSQGVVTYNVKVGFDSGANQVKPGMSVTANIVTEKKVDVLIVPQTAVKTQGRQRYMEVVRDADMPQEAGARVIQGVTLLIPPTRQNVEVGLSNDTETEIVSGLEEGQAIVVRTIAAGAASPVSTQQAPTIFGATGGGNRAGGGNATFRAQR
ncbi:MAG: HlyD family efflux transporter periplasmic adaptor subunit, partial [bacterium]|nr:HlyD family efflux transporter periplasmic adaptor subunit [bacterium]